MKRKREGMWQQCLRPPLSPPLGRYISTESDYLDAVKTNSSATQTHPRGLRVANLSLEVVLEMFHALFRKLRSCYEAVAKQ